MNGSTRIVKNTGVLYLRMLLTVFINLYSTRLILSSLGIDDFGLFSVIGGVIGMLSFLSSSMASSTQRFLSISIGRKKVEEIKAVFTNSLILHFIIGIVGVIFFEIVGMYFIENKLAIPLSKIGIAKTLMHFVIITSFISIISVPYDSVIDANENMIFVFWVGIIESLLKFSIAFSLLYLQSNKLFIYGLLVMISSVLVRIIKQLYTVKKYDECKKISFQNLDFDLMKDMLYFALWNILGILSYMVRNQGILVLFGMFFSTVVVGAFGIASQIINQTSFFSETMMKTMRPQIIKSEGSGDRKLLTKLSIQASKFSFTLMAFFLLPIYFKMEWILNIWLEDVPEYTLVFCRLILILMLLRQLSSGIIVVAHAINKIKNYQLLISPIQLSTLIIGYLFFTIGYSPEYILYIALIVECVSLFFKIYFLKKFINLSKSLYFKEVIYYSFNSFIITFVILFAFDNYLNFSLLINSVLLFIISFLIYPCLVFFLSFTKEEKNKLFQILNFFKEIKFGK